MFVFKDRALPQCLSQLMCAFRVVFEEGIHVDGNHHRGRWLGNGTENGQGAHDHEVCVLRRSLGLHQQPMQLFPVQRCSRMRKENGVFCIMPVLRRCDASSTFALKVALSPEATTDDQKRM